jgi:hypothetical protein
VSQIEQGKREEEEIIAAMRYKLEVQAAHAPYYSKPPADYACDSGEEEGQAGGVIDSDGDGDLRRRAVIVV